MNYCVAAADVVLLSSRLEWNSGDFFEQPHAMMTLDTVAVDQ
jgi:hypothetical protein